MVHNYVFSRPGEAIQRKKLLPFGYFLKGEVQSESKGFEVVFRGVFFWTKCGGRGRGEHIPKVLG